MSGAVERRIFTDVSKDYNASVFSVNPLNVELNPIRHLLALVGARHIVHVSRIRVKQSKKSWTV